MAAVISLHIPEPPPVQNTTFPLNMFSRNTSSEDGGDVVTLADFMIALMRCTVSDVDTI